MSISHNITMLGTGLIGMFYTMTLQGQRGRDRVQVVYSRSQERADAFARTWGIMPQCGVPPRAQCARTRCLLCALRNK